jgi:protein tyrosine phosphatase (PTP) superfamily phosphohydrolase (DUF442 family)
MSDRESAILTCSRSLWNGGALETRADRAGSLQALDYDGAAAFLAYSARVVSALALLDRARSMKNLLALLSLAALAACSSESGPLTKDQAVLTLGLTNGVLVEPGLVSAGQPSEAQMGRLPEVGYDTVISLRSATEKGSGWEEAKAAELGVDFVRIPVPAATGLTEENARKLDEALKQRGDGGAIVSCGSGNRVGGLLALRAHFCQGLPPEQALELGRKAGMTKSEPEVRKALGLAEAK